MCFGDRGEIRGDDLLTVLGYGTSKLIRSTLNGRPDNIRLELQSSYCDLFRVDVLFHEQGCGIGPREAQVIANRLPSLSSPMNILELSCTVLYSVC